MKLNPVRVAGLLFAGVISAFAADQTAAPPAPPSPDQAIISQTDAIVAKVKAKLQAGQSSQADFRDELNAFDQLWAAHASEKTDPVARIGYFEATLYWKVFQNYEKSTALLQRIKNDYPRTQFALASARLLDQLDLEKESMQMQESLHPGAAFPDFVEHDLSGQPLSVGKFKGKVVLVDFWATWCGPCVGELPNVLAAYKKYHDKGFEIVGISLDRDEQALKSFVAAKQMTWPQYFDGQFWDTKLAKKYGVTSIPATYLVGPDGKIVAKNLRGDALDQQLKQLLGN